MGNFNHPSINLSSSESDLRIRLKTDSRYQDFIPRSKTHNVLGYDMKVADVKDVLQGKIWAYSDEERRMSKRQKDLADILRFMKSGELSVPCILKNNVALSYRKTYIQCRYF